MTAERPAVERGGGSKNDRSPEKGSTMKPTTYFLISAVVVVAGCGRDSTPTATPDHPTKRSADRTLKKPRSEAKEKPKEVVWEPSLLAGGYMFEDVQQFGAYVRRAQIVATGVLTEWDGSKGQVRLGSVFHGKLKDKSVPIIATGGVVRPKLGDKVLFLLAPRDGEPKLHSFCGAAGMYKYSDDLAFVVKKSLKSAG